MSDAVNSPSHYTGEIECIDVIKQQYGTEGVKHFCIGNAMKYVYRCYKKDNTTQDIQKAIWYLKKYLELEGINE